MTLAKPPVEASSAVTELASLLATQTWVPSELTAVGELNPQPSTAGALQRCGGGGRRLGRPGADDTQ